MNKNNISIFEEQPEPYSVRVPASLMDKLAKEAKGEGRSRDKQLIAILAERYGMTKARNDK